MTTKQVPNIRMAYSQAATNPELDSQTIMVYNAGATAITAGQVLVCTSVDASGRPNVTTTTTANNAAVCGVAIETIPAGDAGLMAVSGMALINVAASIAQGALLTTSTTAGQANVTGTLGNLLAVLIAYLSGSTTQAICILKLG